jgi:ribonuclease HI
MNLKEKTEKYTKKYTQPLVIATPVYTGYFDGSCEPNKPGGTAAYGAVIVQDGQHIWECSELFYPEQGKEDQTSNNLAEYCGLLAILGHLLLIGAQHESIMVYGDSSLVIQQMFGHWKIKAGVYVPYAHKAQELCRAFSNIGGQWIPRKQNSVADGLSKAPLLKAGIVFRLQPDGQ